MLIQFVTLNSTISIEKTFVIVIAYFCDIINNVDDWIVYVICKLLTKNFYELHIKQFCRKCLFIKFRFWFKWCIIIAIRYFYINKSYKWFLRLLIFVIVIIILFFLIRFLIILIKFLLLILFLLKNIIIKLICFLLNHNNLINRNLKSKILS